MHSWFQSTAVSLAASCMTEEFPYASSVRSIQLAIFYKQNSCVFLFAPLISSLMPGKPQDSRNLRALHRKERKEQNAKWNSGSTIFPELKVFKCQKGNVLKDCHPGNVHLFWSQHCSGEKRRFVLFSCKNSTHAWNGFYSFFFFSYRCHWYVWALHWHRCVSCLVRPFLGNELLRIVHWNKQEGKRQAAILEELSVSMVNKHSALEFLKFFGSKESICFWQSFFLTVC